MTYPTYPRTWSVWHPAGGEEGPEDGTDYIADSAEAAAVKWAEDFDEDDYTLSYNGDHREVVRVVEQDNKIVSDIHVFTVRAVLEINYYADEVTS